MKNATVNCGFRPFRGLIAAFLVSGVAGGAWAEGPAALTLDDCYKAALKQSEAVAEQGELAVQASEHVWQATGSLLPTVNGVASYLREDQSGQTNSLKKTVAPTTQPLVKVTADQPLFRGGREYFGIRQAGKLADAQKCSRQQAEVSLYRDVVQAFYNVLSIEKDIKGLGGELASYDGRIKELEGRVQIGRSRTSEILAAQSAQAGLQGQAEQLKGQLAVARESFSFLTGIDRSAILADAEPSATALEPLERYLGGLERRPDVAAAALRAEAANAGLWSARCALLPSVDLIGNYYLKRSGISEDIKWDAQVALTVPLFAGGANLSRIREASSVERQNKLESSRVSRLAEQDIRTLYSRVVSDRALVSALAAAADLAERNYGEQASDYRLGLVTNVDVLQALASAQDSKRALDRASYVLNGDMLALQAASGMKP